MNFIESIQASAPFWVGQTLVMITVPAIAIWFEVRSILKKNRETPAEPGTFSLRVAHYATRLSAAVRQPGPTGLLLRAVLSIGAVAFGFLLVVLGIPVLDDMIFGWGSAPE